MTQFSRFFFGFFTLVFLLFTYWQFNDVDPILWVSIYGFSALMCAFAAFGRYYVPVLILAAIAALIAGLFYFPNSVGHWVIAEWKQADLSMKTQEMEIARESFGFLIVSGVMGLAAFFGWRKKRKKP